mmetsp:Transcript_22758/g.53088  ORF Transcript_22758/g.53088 Transcript_22758/m.53088 type:complete len:205 (+) Transcript_22758:1387-2001(+)
MSRAHWHHTLRQISAVCPRPALQGCEACHTLVRAAFFETANCCGSEGGYRCLRPPRLRDVCRRPRRVVGPQHVSGRASTHRASSLPILLARLDSVRGQAQSCSRNRRNPTSPLPVGVPRTRGHARPRVLCSCAAQLPQLARQRAHSVTNPPPRPLPAVVVRGAPPGANASAVEADGQRERVCSVHIVDAVGWPSMRSRGGGSLG